jgi:hypothetical protein
VLPHPLRKLVAYRLRLESVGVCDGTDGVPWPRTARISNRQFDCIGRTQHPQLSSDLAPGIRDARSSVRSFQTASC